MCVWMFGGEPQPGPGAPKRSVFMAVGHLRVLPHTKEQKTSQNSLQEYLFMEVLAGPRFEVFEVHPSIHPSIRALPQPGPGPPQERSHPSIHTYIHTYVHPSIGQNRFCMVFTVVLETYMEKWGGQKVVAWSCMYVCLSQKAQ